MDKTKIVILRHGESKWNLKNRFTGWKNINLTKKGIKESKKTGEILKKHGFFFKKAYTSYLNRAIHTVWNVLFKMDQLWIPVIKSWKLNERHYGKLQGMNKNYAIQKYGEKQINLWRRGFFDIPPQISNKNKYFPGKDIRYQNLNLNKIPVGESLEITYNRVIPF